MASAVGEGDGDGDGEGQVVALDVDVVPGVSPEDAVAPVVGGDVAVPVGVLEFEALDVLGDGDGPDAFAGVLPVDEGAVGVLDDEVSVVESDFAEADGSLLEVVEPVEVGAAEGVGVGDEDGDGGVGLGVGVRPVEGDGVGEDLVERAVDDEELVI